MIYTIGYGGMKSIDELKTVIKDEKKGIELLFDVRSKPLSRRVIFNRAYLEKEFAWCYRWQGLTLGGMAPIAESSIKDLANRSAAILLMCAEKDPAKCHRHYDIAVRLLKYGVVCIHLFDGKEIPADKL